MEADTFCQIDPVELAECQQKFNQGGVKACENFLHQQAEQWKTIPLNIGIIGNSGTGKSSFINAVRGLTADDEGAANVGVTETTTISIPYPHPNNELLKFWDLPGVGTQQFPQETYLEQIGFPKFDFFLIISSERFRENDIWIASEINKKRKQFFFIRSKIHSSLKDDRVAHPKTHNKENVLASIRENIKNNLGTLYREDGVFLIDNHKPMSYDFDHLLQCIIDEMPTQKRNAFILSITKLSEEMIKRKVEALHADTWKIATLSAVGAAVPLPGVSIAVDILLIVNQNRTYFRQLGLDEESLRKTAEIMKCDFAELNKVVKKSSDEYLTVQGLKALITGSSLLLAAEASEAIFKYLPFLGSAAAGAISFASTRKILNMILSRLEATALVVMQIAAQNSANMIDKKDDDDDD